MVRRAVKLATEKRNYSSKWAAASSLFLEFLTAAVPVLYYFTAGRH